MLKQIWIILFLGSSLSLLGQRSEVDMNVPGVITDATAQKRAFKAIQPTEDKTESWDVTALGQSVYAASNLMDGTASSYQHSLRIVVALQTPGYKNGTVQLVFYGPEDKIRQATENEGGVISIYYPVSVYESLRTRLEQALTARKKVTVKITQKTSGYREGVLLF